MYVYTIPGTVLEQQELSIEMVYTSASVLTTDEKYGLREKRQKIWGARR
jgi:hypothetical protein